MTRPMIQIIAKAGQQKGLTAKQEPMIYFVLAIIAGIFIFVGGIFSILTAAWFYSSSVALSKLLCGLTFATALTLVVFLGGELFTGCNLVMGIALYEKQAKLSDALRVWVMSYLGNFVGIFIFCALFVASALNHEVLLAYLELVVPGKLSLPWYTLIIKGALCNFLVCLGVYAGFKLESNFVKVTVILMVITTFVLAGLEHSVANMVFFSLYGLLSQEASLLGMAYNLCFVTIGNLIGGAALLGLPLWYCAQGKPLVQPED